MEVEIVKQNEQELASEQSAMVDIQVSTAKKYPRDMQKVANDIFSSIVSDRRIAKECFYAIKKEGKIIHGGTIRLAEIVAHEMGNLRIQGKIVSKNRNTVVLEGIAWDLEKNIAYSSQVEKSIKYKDGNRYGDSMITLVTNAGLSIAIRNVIFKVFPTAMLNTLQGKIKSSFFKTKRDKQDVIDKSVILLEKKGISKTTILKFFNKSSFDDFSTDNTFDLQGICMGIEFGDFTAREVFDKVSKGTSFFS